MRVPAISYRASQSHVYDFGFYRLPNTVSQGCFNFNELRTTLQKIVDGTYQLEESTERRQIVNECLAAVEGPLACERIVDVLEQMTGQHGKSNKPWVGERLKGWLLWAGRTRVKRYKDSRPGSHNRLEFQKHRYPDVSLEDIRERIARFQHLLGTVQDLKVDKWRHQFFQISAPSSAI
jgi:hypothetical protein